jgi:hypothetical protein
MMKEGKLFGLINIIDLCAIILIVVAIAGYMMVKTGAHKTSAQVVKDRTEIEFDVFSRGQKILNPEGLFKDETQSFLTIRNVPYTALDIIKYECTPWQISVLHTEDNTAVAIDDPSAPITYDCMLTLKDTADITKDGPVIGGNKIKVGLRVDIEGFKYRLPAIVSDVRIIDKNK